MQTELFFMAKKNLASGIFYFGSRVNTLLEATKKSRSFLKVLFEIVIKSQYRSLSLYLYLF